MCLYDKDTLKCVARYNREAVGNFSPVGIIVKTPYIIRWKGDRQVKIYDIEEVRSLLERMEIDRTSLVSVTKEEGFKTLRIVPERCESRITVQKRRPACCSRGIAIHRIPSVCCSLEVFRYIPNGRRGWSIYDSPWFDKKEMEQEWLDAHTRNCGQREPKPQDELGNLSWLYFFIRDRWVLFDIILGYLGPSLEIPFLKSLGDICCPKHSPVSLHATSVTYRFGGSNPIFLSWDPEDESDDLEYHFSKGADVRLAMRLRFRPIPKILYGDRKAVRNAVITHDLNNWVATRIEDDKVFQMAVVEMERKLGKCLQGISSMDYTRLCDGMNGSGETSVLSQGREKKMASQQRHVRRHRKYVKSWEYLRMICTNPFSVAIELVNMLREEGRLPHGYSLSMMEGRGDYRGRRMEQRIVDYIKEPAMTMMGTKHPEVVWDIESRIENPLAIALQLRYSPFPSCNNVYERLFCVNCVKSEEYQTALWAWVEKNRLSDVRSVWPDDPDDNTKVMAIYNREWEREAWSRESRGDESTQETQLATQPEINYSPTPVAGEEDNGDEDIIPATPLAQSPDVHEFTAEEFEEAKLPEQHTDETQRDVIDLTGIPDDDYEERKERRRRFYARMDFASTN